MTAFRPTAGLILLLAATSPAAAQTPVAPAEAKPDAVIEAVPGGGSTAAPTTPTPDDAKGVSGEDAAATTAPVSPDASAATQTAPAAPAADAAQAGTGPADAAAGPEKAEPASADDKADAKADAGAGNAPPGASDSSAATGDSAAAGSSTAADAPTAPDGDNKAAASPGDRASEQTDAKPAADNADAGQAPAPAPQASEGAPAPSTAQPDVAQPGNAAPATPADAAPAPAAAAVRQEPEEPPAPPAPPAPKLAVQTGGGAFAQAYQQVVLTPFSEETGVEITEAPDDGSAGDLLLLDSAELARRCSKGDLLSLEVSELVPSSGSMRDDFLDGALKPCGIAALAWSHVFAFDPARFAKRIPTRAADVFDVRRFPGKRALPADGRGLIEAVLVADGVAPGDVYATLATSDGIGRVVKRLKSLGDNIVWYDHLPEAIALVRAGKAAIALTSNGHAFMEQARSGPLGLIWDGQVLHASYFAVPKDTSDAAQAKKLVAFAARPEKLASLVRQIPYGPMRHSAVAGATGLRHAVTGQELADFLPTAPENLKGAVRFDAAWWDANADRMAGVLRTVRVGPPLPTRP